MTRSVPWRRGLPGELRRFLFPGPGPVVVCPPEPRGRNLVPLLVAVTVIALFAAGVALYRHVPDETDNAPDRDALPVVGQTLVGFDDVRDFPNITRGLVKRGYSDEQVRGILGENALRVFADVCG